MGNLLDYPGQSLSIGLSERSLQFSEPEAGPRFRIRFETDRDCWDPFQATRTTGMRVAGQGAFQGGDQVFAFEAWNPNPTAGRNKDGEVYRLTFEVDEATWWWFLHYTRPSDVFGMRLWREADAPEPAPEPARPFAGVAKTLHKAGFFRGQMVAQALGTEETFAAYVRALPCAVCGDYDTDPDTGRRATQYAHVTRVSAGSGTAIKPPYHAFPLCYHDHSTVQHNNGWISLRQRILRAKGRPPEDVEAVTRGKARDWADRKATETRASWAHERFRAECGVASLTHASPELIRETAGRLGIGWALPELEAREDA